ncbi:PHB depolymerase family esterase [Sphingopyxis sp.]|uniref:extracellular catalytic domain type 1 short-chain-length polyhydroxyalkanoate depolymerase n=1 Tax=Sphingopyxis sp. TaxID=1908224 RepID=UPI001DFD032B|nr:PHB depolymerase family esterase [Sphingopyxis sp.]MBW8294321.1 PHB depolymerase family esterase [Sphingopyxis sp.]
MIATPSLMADALRLTRSGDLREATRLIQAGLSKNLSNAPRADARSAAVVDVTPSRLALALPSRVPEIMPDAATPSGLRDPGIFEERRFIGAEGKMSYMLYRPSSVKDGMPVVIMLHGCTQGPEDFARGTGMNALADEMGFVVAYPRQTSAANLQRCWNWFKPGDQQRDKGEPALIAATTRQIVSELKADAHRVYVAGLSAGGAAAAILGAAYPDIYAAIGVHSGLGCGAARDMPSAFAAMRNGPPKSQLGGKSRQFVPVVTFHGDGDATVNEENSAHIIADAEHQCGIDLILRKETGGWPAERRYTRETHSEPGGNIMIERWTVHGAGHAWSGGHPSGTYTDPSGPDASRAMMGFLLRHSLAKDA